MQDDSRSAEHELSSRSIHLTRRTAEIERTFRSAEGELHLRGGPKRYASERLRSVSPARINLTRVDGPTW